ncbi:MAG: helix-turn-helix domain-containing protein [Proteobacteria bacterium]|nr:helix-turn-helix domain-containing protein [Pseudomonadota bacterium]
MPTEEPGEQAEAGAETTETTVTLGEILQQERLRRGLSEREVADRLHISMYYVKALEANKFEKLPGAVYAKGYIKNYASLLNLDASELIPLYEEFSRKQSAVAESELGYSTRRKLDRNKFWLVVSVLVFVGGFTLLWLYNSFVTEDEVDAAGTRPSPGLTQATTPTTPTTAAEQTASAGTPKQTPRSSPVVLAEPDSKPVSDTNFIAALAAIADGNSSSIAPSTPIGSVTIAAGNREIDALAAAVAPRLENTRLIEIGSGGEDLLRITFSGESWIEVNDGESRQIYRDLGAAGDVLEITGNAPFNILLGDAPFIQMSLNGTEIDVGAKIRVDNSARLTVGL